MRVSRKVGAELLFALIFCGTLIGTLAFFITISLDNPPIEIKIIYSIGGTICLIATIICCRILVVLFEQEQQVN